MQIVINICKDDFEEICMQARMVEDTGSLFGRIRKAIFHGVPLPKGHGRLIDADELYGDFIDGTEGYDCQTWNRSEIGDVIEYAPTIIEKDDEVES